MSPLTEAEQQYNGDEVANLIQLNSNSRWLDVFHPANDAIDNEVLLKDYTATGHYKPKEVDTH